MSYLEKLRALETEKAATPAPTKPTEAARVPTKAPSVGSVGTPPPTLKNIWPSSGTRAATAEPGIASLRQRALDTLAERPAANLAIVCYGEGDPVPVVVAIRDKGLCEIHIPAAAFEPFTLLELIGQHGGASIH